ncbi:FAD-dependent oxidoreductase [Streptomyces sp. 4N509B]|uniref:FAD-dependent oxidoreductase n=1 Tax=Streptomyces sp. 4N509B TaxID=3457413 RepID=UPI003FD3439D
MRHREHRARHRPAPDVVVVGGGVIGLVTAWRAAQRGMRTAVVDPSPGGGAARVAAGMLAPVTELHHGEEALLRLSLASADRYPDFAAELADVTGVGIGYRACGTLVAALDADDRAQLRELRALQLRCGLSAEWLTGRECRRLEPMLAPGVRGGLRVDGDHQADPRRLLAALLLACERAGVAFHRSWAAELVVAETGGGFAAADHTAAGPASAEAGGDGPWGGLRACGVVLADGELLPAGQVVLAAGCRAAELDGLPAGLLPPVRPVKGQVLRLRMSAGGPPLLSRTLRAVVRGSQVYLVPRLDGELVLGATSEEQGFDTTVTAGGVYQLLRDAHELVPGITELPLVECEAGLRPGSPDNGPLLGPSGLPGLHLATGHHRNGVLLAPVTGDALAEALASGQLPEPARPFGADRFARVPASGTPGAPGATGVPDSATNGATNRATGGGTGRERDLAGDAEVSA